MRQCVDTSAVTLHFWSIVFVMQDKTIAVSPVGEHFWWKLGFIGADPLWRMIKQHCSRVEREEKEKAMH